MTATNDFGSLLAAWAQPKAFVTGLALIGSRERSKDDAVWRSDPQSDWDFHLITSNTDIFLNRDWTRELNGADFRVYVVRMTRIGTVPKVNAVLGDTEVDLVIIPAKLMRKARFFTRLRLHRRPGWTRQFLQDLAIVVRPGFRFLKDTGGWEAFYRRALEEVSDARISDEAAAKLADGYVCDYVWTLRKIERGELVTAQRMLHRELTETNLRLLHELRLRRGERSFPEARRIERVASREEWSSVAPDARLDAGSLMTALERSGQACRDLMVALVGAQWRWPKLGR